MSLIKWNNFFKGIRFRITLVYSTLFGLFLLVFAYVITKQYFESGRNDFDSNLINYAIDISDHLITDPSGVEVAIKIPMSEEMKALPFILSLTNYSVRDLSGKTLLQSFKNSSLKEIPFDPNLIKKLDYTHRLHSFKVGDEFFRAVNIKITANKKEMLLQVATPFNNVLERETKHLLMVSIVLPLLIVSSSFFSFLIAGKALNPIKALIDSANNIAAQNLSLRVPEANTGDEVEELSKTLNSLLKRLEESFASQENFVANASHQLNTPLAIIKGELDVLESKIREPYEIKKFHQSLREELQRLIDLVKNMLLVSRVTSGLDSFVFRPLRLDDLLLTTSSRLNLKAREKRIIVRFNISEELLPEDLEVMGEKQLLDALFENLLDNAIKYSPVDSTIYLDIKNVKEKAEVWIRDEGIGMEEEEFKEMSSRRFQRGSHAIPGTGIGLSIANKIAGLHNSQITYEKIRPQGSLFIVRFH